MCANIEGTRVLKLYKTQNIYTKLNNNIQQKMRVQLMLPDVILYIAYISASKHQHI